MEISLGRLVRVAAVAALVLLAANGAQAVTVWQESVNGDLSNSGGTPTDINVTAGTNSVIAAMPGSDLDFLTIHVPEDHEFTGLVLSAYTSTDRTSFIGMLLGETIAVTGDAEDLTGYAHFGAGTPGPNNINTDILDDICTGAGAQGCSPPLPSGAYSFWIQQAAAASVTYQFDFIIEAVEEPDPILIGDYNGDNKVSAADFTTWRENVGADTLTNRDPDNEGPVDAPDFDSWLEHYGDVPEGSAAGAASVPEPSAILLACCAAIVGLVTRRMLR